MTVSAVYPEYWSARKNFRSLYGSTTRRFPALRHIDAAFFVASFLSHRLSEAHFVRTYARHPAEGFHPLNLALALALALRAPDLIMSTHAHRGADRIYTP